MLRNYFKGGEGDMINTLMAVAAFKHDEDAMGNP